MKFFNVFSLSLIFIGYLSAQQAQDYFPQQSGYVWNYRTSVLDSNNMETESFYRIDSFAVESPYQGRTSKVILSKAGTDFTILQMPYLDTSYFSLENSDAYSYTDFLPDSLKNILTGVDTSLLGILNLLESFEGWYPLYKFAQSVNQEYEILQYDTTIVINNIPLPLRFQANGKRIQDENLQTEIGNFDCKKFIITGVISIVIFVPIPVLTVNDTVYIAPNNWIVKEFTPSTSLDLSLLQLGTINIPGFKTDIISQITAVEGNELSNDKFKLQQNYPNPFNPETIINYEISEASKIKISIYDLLGRELGILENSEKPSGNYNIKLNSNDYNLSSGSYFYKIDITNQSGTYSHVKKMILLR